MKLRYSTPLASIGRSIVFIIMGVLVTQGNLHAADDADALAKSIDSELRSAERLMFNGKKEESNQALIEVAAKIDQLKALDPAHSKLKSIESKYTRTRTALDKRMGITTKTASARPVPPKPAAPSSPSTPRSVTASVPVPAVPDKLPAGVSKRLRDIEGFLESAGQYIDEGRVDSAQYQLDKVPPKFEEMDRMYSGKFSKDHPDYVATLDKVAAVEKRLNEAAGEEAAAAEATAQAGADLEKQADEWIKKMSPFISGSYLPAGHTPAKELIFPGTAHPEKFPAMQTVFEEAKAVYDAYVASGMAEKDIPWQLNQAASDLKFAIDGYASSAKSATSGLLTSAQDNLEQALVQLGKSGWKSDPEALPPMIDKDCMQRIDALIGTLEYVLDSGDERLTGLKEKQSEVASIDAEHRQAWQSRIRVRKEIYGGSDLKELRNKAEAIVMEDVPQAKILRVSIYQDDWKEESVIESTDSTNTAVRHRVTRMINAQVAAKAADGNVLLHTLHIAKDKRSDGSWGSLYGHVMFSDAMLEENVQK